METEGKKCKVCGRPIDAFVAAKNEGMCRDCFSKKVNKIVHPF